MKVLYTPNLYTRWITCAWHRPVYRPFSGGLIRRQCWQRLKEPL